MLVGAGVLDEGESLQLAHSLYEFSNLLLFNVRRNVDDAQLVRAILDNRGNLVARWVCVLIGRGSNVILGAADGQTRPVGSSSVVTHRDSVHSQSKGRIFGCLEL